jgi:hypothetical protein
MILQSSIPFLDECGSVYLAGVGPRQECIRLNQVASRLWRTSVGSATSGDVRELALTERSFLERLLSEGTLIWEAA